MYLGERGVLPGSAIYKCPPRRAGLYFARACTVARRGFCFLARAVRVGAASQGPPALTWGVGVRSASPSHGLTHATRATPAAGSHLFALDEFGGARP